MTENAICSILKNRIDEYCGVTYTYILVYKTVIIFYPFVFVFFLPVNILSTVLLKSTTKVKLYGTFGLYILI